MRSSCPSTPNAHFFLRNGANLEWHMKSLFVLALGIGLLSGTAEAADAVAAPLQEALADELVRLAGLPDSSKVFFCSTGLEANEGALKIARKFGHDKGIARPEIIVYDKAFHGRSIATLSATGNPKVQLNIVEIKQPELDAALIAQGVADPKRVGIYGASYGGYATLMGLVNDPDLYRCGIAWVAVSANVANGLPAVPDWAPRTMAVSSSTNSTAMFSTVRTTEPATPESAARARTEPRAPRFAVIAAWITPSAPATSAISTAIVPERESISRTHRWPRSGAATLSIALPTCRAAKPVALCSSLSSGPKIPLASVPSGSLAKSTTAPPTSCTASWARCPVC